MKLHWISVLALLLAISSMQWGVSTGEELDRRASNSRLRRQLYNSDSSDINVELYVVYSLIGLCVFITLCVIIGIIGCIAVFNACTTNSSSRNATTHVTTTQAVPYPKPQPYNYSYPQPVQTHGYYPPGPPAVKAHDDSRPPSYSTTQLGIPCPNHT